MSWKPLRAVNYLVVHCAATRPSMDIGAAWIRSMHRRAGWLDIGYHFVIKRDGTVEPGRPTDRPGAHARGFNHLSLGICLAGGVSESDVKKPENNFTEAQFVALRSLLKAMKETYPDAIILGHRDLPNVAKACPSFDVREWWAEE